MIFASILSKALGLPPPGTASPADAPISPPLASASPPTDAAAPAPAASSIAAAALSPLEPAPAALEDRSFFSRRALGQFGLFAAGATFLVLSTAVTRRSVVRRQREARLKFFQQSGGTVDRSGGIAMAETRGTRAAAALADTEPVAGGSTYALEALHLATLNVVSFFIMMTGGVAWALDISTLDDLRRRARKHTRPQRLDGQGPAVPDAESEREVSEFLQQLMGHMPAVASAVNTVSPSADQPGESTSGESKS